MLISDFDNYKKGFKDLLGDFAIFPHISISFKFSAFSLTLHYFYTLKSYIYKLNLYISSLYYFYIYLFFSILSYF